MKIGIIAVVAALVASAQADEIAAVSRAGNVAVVTNDLYPKPLSPQIWTLRPWKKRCVVAINSEKLIGSPALSHDGRLLAWCYNGEVIQLFDTRTGKLLARLGSGHPQPVENGSNQTILAFSPDGSTLALGGKKGIFIWDLRRRELVFSLPLRYPGSSKPSQQQKQAAFYALQFSPDGRTLAVAGASGSTDFILPLFLVDVARRKARHLGDIDCSDGLAYRFAFSPTGNRLMVVSVWIASAASFDQLHLFETRTGRLLWKWQDKPANFGQDPNDIARSRSPNAAAFSSDGRRVAVSGPGFLEIRRARDGRLLASRQEKDLDNVPPARQKQLRAELNVR